MGAVQAQDHLGVKWALGLRTRGASERSIEQALAEGSLLRTHAMRWTWQLVAPEDVRFILDLVAPRLLASSVARNRSLGLDAKTFRRSEAVLDKALAAGDALTRTELARAFAAARIDASGPRLSHLLANAELRALIVSGPPAGKQRTHVLFDRRVPRGKRLSREVALEELGRRYFTSRGPATLADFVWWSGLTMADARAAVEALGRELESETDAGTTYYRGASAAAPRSNPAAWLLPAFDEYLIAYKDRAAMLDPSRARRVNAGGGMLSPCLVVGGRVIGTWQRKLEPGRVVIEIAPFGRASATELESLRAAARRYADFLGLEAHVRQRR
jgi:hypothetical protein